MMLNIFRNENGFTLVEVLLTIGLIGILSASVLSLFTNATERQLKIASDTLAMNIAQAGIEQTIADKRLKGYNYLMEEKYKLEHFNGMIREISIDTLGTSIKKIVVKVKWAGGSDSLVTLIGNY